MTAPSELSLPVAPPGSVLIVGTGLIGTSIALALTAAGVDVTVDDTNPAHLAVAIARGAGRPPAAGDLPEHVVLAVPPKAVARVLLPLQRLYPDASFSDVSSVKSVVEADIETLGGSLHRFVGGHPMAGRERGGPDQADAALFVGRTWALCATPVTTPVALAAARSVAQWCDAVPVITTAARHDGAVALLSHLPQLTASALSALAVPVPDAELRLAGQGWRDMTRIADSDPALWAEIVAGNAAALARPLAALIEELSTVLNAVTTSQAVNDSESSNAQRADPQNDVETALAGVTRALVGAGNEGRRRLPDKDALSARWDRVVAVVADRPGELARLLLAAGAAGVNVEDLQVEHQAAHHTGDVTLHVVQGQAGGLADVLRGQGWRCRVESAPLRTAADTHGHGSGSQVTARD